MEYRINLETRDYYKSRLMNLQQNMKAACKDGNIDLLRKLKEKRDELYERFQKAIRDELDEKCDEHTDNVYIDAEISQIAEGTCSSVERAVLIINDMYNRSDNSLEAWYGRQSKSYIKGSSDNEEEISDGDFDEMLILD